MRRGARGQKNSWLSEARPSIRKMRRSHIGKKTYGRAQSPLRMRPIRLQRKCFSCKARRTARSTDSMRCTFFSLTCTGRVPKPEKDLLSRISSGVFLAHREKGKHTLKYGVRGRRRGTFSTLLTRQRELSKRLRHI